jgi:hypothetical protein
MKPQVGKPFAPFQLDGLRLFKKLLATGGKTQAFSGRRSGVLRPKILSPGQPAGLCSHPWDDDRLSA